MVCLSLVQSSISPTVSFVLWSLRATHFAPLEPSSLMEPFVSCSIQSSKTMSLIATIVNVAGAEAMNAGGGVAAGNGAAVQEGFDKTRTYAPGPCNGNCAQDWVGGTHMLQHTRWYPTAQTMVDGSVLIVGGADAGGLVLNEASINVPTYEIIHHHGAAAPKPVILPILEFSAAQNLQPGFSYNLYPILELMPNTANANQFLTIAGNRAVIWDYTKNVLIKTLPNTPVGPRTFPSSATAVMLPLVAPNFTPTLLLCGGSSGDMPNPKALNDCYTIKPLDNNPVWTRTDSMPGGARTMSDGILLPDGTVLIVNGARIGSGGGFMAEGPAFAPIIYDPSKPAGRKFTTMPSTNIPRLYHSVATLIPSGEVLIAGSNPAVGYTQIGKVSPRWPIFNNHGHVCALKQQQYQTSAYPTEYRVQKFSPDYMTAAARPIITRAPKAIRYGATFHISAGINGKHLRGTVKVMLGGLGFHTHAVGMNQRMLQLAIKPVPNSNLFTVTAPPGASVLAPGVYLIYAVRNGVPSKGVWVKLRG